MRRRTVLGGLAGFATYPALAQAAEVDLLLVLGIDISRSVTDDEAVLQRNGYRAAMTDKAVLAAIANGASGAIGVVYFEWAAYEVQEVVVPWTRIAGAADAALWAERLGASPWHSRSWTSLSGALRFSHALLDQAPYQATRRVVDISGDGANNNGPPAEEERDRLVEAGVTINGLPIINYHPRFGRLELDVDRYYRDSVIGGPGAFYIVAKDFADFADAIRRKLIQEIAANSLPTLG